VVSGRKVILFVDRPLSYSRAMQRIKELWRAGKFTWCRHAEERLVSRGLDITDVESIVRSGRVVGHSKPASLWRYTVEGPTVEAKAGGIVCELAGDLLVLVSVMLRGTWRQE
jgi:hypothetical protein